MFLLNGTYATAVRDLGTHIFERDGAKQGSCRDSSASKDRLSDAGGPRLESQSQFERYGRFTYQPRGPLWVRFDQDLILKGQSETPQNTDSSLGSLTRRKNTLNEHKVIIQSKQT